MSDYHFETHRPVRLFVENGSGTVQITATETTESRVETAGRDADDVLVEQDGDQINVIAPRQRAGFFGDRELHFTITVPTGSDLSIKTGSAEVTAGGEYGAARIKSGSGDVYVERLTSGASVETGSGDVELDATAELQVKSGSGDIAIQRADGALSVSTGSGDVEIGTAVGPAVVKTGSGDLKVVEAQSDVAMTTGSGDLTIQTAVRGRFQSKGASGDVHIGVPAGVPVWTDLSTVSGRIASDLAGAGEPTEGADYVELRAKTVSGDITLTEV